MSQPTTIPATLQDGRILPEEPRSEIAERVIDGEIIVLKDIFDAADLRDLRSELFKWGQETPEIGSSTQKRDTTFHSVDVNPEEGSHPKVYHSFNFIFPGEKEETVDAVARPYFEALRELQNDLAGTDGDFGDLEGLAMRPIVIHYPRGGGGFPLHTHPYLPQKIGLIVNLSRYGEDYSNGGTRFALPTGEVVDVEGHHDIGDIVLFRIDLPHNVHPCDPEVELNFDDPAGRWSMILPYNRY